MDINQVNVEAIVKSVLEGMLEQQGSAKPDEQEQPDLFLLQQRLRC